MLGIVLPEPSNQGSQDVLSNSALDFVVREAQTSKSIANLAIRTIPIPLRIAWGMVSTGWVVISRPIVSYTDLTSGVVSPVSRNREGIC